MSTMVNELVRKVAESPFNDRLSRGIDWLVIGLMLLLLLEYELVNLSRRSGRWKASARTWVYLVPLVIAGLFVIAQRLKNAR